MQKISVLIHQRAFRVLALPIVMSIIVGFQTYRYSLLTGDPLTMTYRKQDYATDDIVTWMLPGNPPHIDFVTDKVSERVGNPLFVYNIGLGLKLDDMLFDYMITGHY